jgi:GntR family transcriptional regulator
MQIHLDLTGGVPIFRQIVQQVKYLVACGRLAPGEELPPIRALAEQLVINPNTVARAYKELELAGVVSKRSTTGTFVSSNGAGMPQAERLELLVGRADALVAEARQMNVGLDALCELVRRRHEALEEGES